MPEVIAMVGDGKCSLTRAYEASKLYKVQQVSYAQNGYAVMPKLSPADLDKAIDWLVRVGLKQKLQAVDYLNASMWTYLPRIPADFVPGEISGSAGGWLRIEKSNSMCFKVQLLDSTDTDAEPLAEGFINTSNEKLFAVAKKLYIDKDALAATKQAKQTEKQKQAAKEKERKARLAAAQRELDSLEAWDSYDRTGRLGMLGLDCREYDLPTGGCIVIIADTSTEYKNHEKGGTSGFMYGRYWCARFNSTWQRVNMETGKPSKYGADIMDCWKDGENALQQVREVIAKCL